MNSSANASRRATKVDPIHRPDDRQAALAHTRNLKMARSAHAYVRGSTAKFYEWLDQSAGKVPHGPAVWICGDCHLGNLGPLADAKGRVAVQIRDLDQTVIGNPAHDLIRLGLSLASAARGSDLPGATTARIVEQLMAGYEAALAGDFERPADKSNRPDIIQNLLEQSVRRRWRHLAQERLDGVKPEVPLGRRFWALTPKERTALGELFAGEELRVMVTGLKQRDNDAAVELVDAAYWMKGCSSLGRLRYVVMLKVGDADRSGLCLIDVKEGVTAAAPKDAKAVMPRDNAVRVVTGAKALSPNLGERMIAARLLDKAVVLRELMPQDLKIEVEHLTQDEAAALAAYLAGVVGRAHGRQMDLATRKAWRGDLSHAHTATLGAPSWLWSSIVELLAVHEGAYLDHCRRFALEEAA
jgi:uncharacterized protein (DUF2252 family)